jgi:transporter family-2 protein
MSNHFGYAAVMFLAGVGIPVMAALNGGLGTRLQNPTLAASILLFVGLSLSLVLLFAHSDSSKAIYASETPWYYYMGGIFFIFYIVSITTIAPKFGVGNAVAFVLLGQLFAMSAIDHYGLFEAPRLALSMQRISGLLLMTLGIFLVVRRT